METNGTTFAPRMPLAENPRPAACVAMAEEQDVYRVRVGEFRIAFEVIDAMLIRHLVGIGHRREAYG